MLKGKALCISPLHAHTGHTLKQTPNVCCWMEEQMNLPPILHLSFIWLGQCTRGFPVDSVVKNLPAMQETRVWSLGWGHGMAAHSSVLARESHEQRTWRAAAHRVAESHTTEATKQQPQHHNARLCQPWHFWRFSPGNSLGLGAVLCLVGCLTASRPLPTGYQ